VYLAVSILKQHNCSLILSFAVTSLMSFAVTTYVYYIPVTRLFMYTGPPTGVEGGILLRPQRARDQKLVTIKYNNVKSFLYTRRKTQDV